MKVDNIARDRASRRRHVRRRARRSSAARDYAATIAAMRARARKRVGAGSRCAFRAVRCHRPRRHAARHRPRPRRRGERDARGARTAGAAIRRAIARLHRQGLAGLVAPHAHRRADGERGAGTLRARAAALRASLRRESRPAPRLIPASSRGSTRMHELGLPPRLRHEQGGRFTLPLLDRAGLARILRRVVSGDTSRARSPIPLPVLHACDAARRAPRGDARDRRLRERRPRRARRRLRGVVRAIRLQRGPAGATLAATRVGSATAVESASRSRRPRRCSDRCRGDEPGYSPRDSPSPAPRHPSRDIVRHCHLRTSSWLPGELASLALAGASDA